MKITRAHDDTDGRIFFVGVRREGSELNHNAVWLRDYDRAVAYATEFLKDEKELMEAVNEKH